MTTDAPYTARLGRMRARMDDLGVDVVLLSVGPDLPYLTGYEAMGQERLTMLVVGGAEATLVVPRLEVLRVVERPEAFTIRAWDETDDPIAIVAGLCGGAREAAVGDQTWARFVIDLQAAMPATRFRRATEVIGHLRMQKEPAEIDALRAAAHAVDAIAVAMRDRPFAGRRESEVRRELVDRILEVGHETAKFAIVASGPNAASPHHEPGERVIAEGEVVLCDFGGVKHGYCSDITRMFVVGEPASEVRDVYDILVEAQERAVRSATVGAPCESVDAAARGVIADAGYGEQFVHRTGHGIGIELHEEPYIVSGNTLPLAVGHAFSVEPGIYLPGRFGLRLEDIVVATEAGPERLNDAPRDLAVVG